MHLYRVNHRSDKNELIFDLVYLSRETFSFGFVALNFVFIIFDFEEVFESFVKVRVKVIINNDVENKRQHENVFSRA